MDPISSLSAEQAQQLRGVCFDVDDTVTDGGVVNPKAFEALHALCEAGLYLVAATGRPLGWAELIARTWPVHAAVGENGAGWCYRRDNQLVRGYLLDEAQRTEEQRRLHRLRRLVARQMPEVRESDDSWCRRCDAAFDIGERVSLAEEHVQQLVQLIQSEGARAVISSIHAHACFGDYDKAKGIVAATAQALDRDLNQEREHWLFVGDSANDGPAFSWFELTAGVANVRDILDDLPKAPAFIAPARGGAGFAAIADHVLRMRLSRD